jgi:Fe-S cluster biogenesis protein NfuA
MTSTLDRREFQARLERLDALLRESEHSADPAARSRLQEVVRAILDLHGAGLERVVEHLEDAGDCGRAILDACASDALVAGLLLLHGLHPLDVEARVRQALDGVRPYLQAHGGNVELLRVDGNVVRLQLHGNCHGCPSSAATMKQTIEEAIYGKAPEVTAIEVAGEAARPPTPDDSRARVALPIL